MDIGIEIKKIMKEAIIGYVKSGIYDKKKADNVISHLQLGWKFEDILEDFYTTYGENYFDFSDIKTVGDFMKELEQKYFTQDKVVK